MRVPWTARRSNQSILKAPAPFLSCTSKFQIREENERPLVAGKVFHITVIQVYAPTSNSEEAEVERFYEDLQDLLELTLKKDVLFLIED